MKSRWARAGLALVFLLVTAPLRAEGGSVLAVAAGLFEVGDETYQTGEAGLQWRGGGHLWILHPMAGGMVTFKGSYHLYAGFSFDLPLGRGLVLRPSFAPGYFHQGSGKDLGYALEFRSGLEAAWRFTNGVRLGVELNHISNAGLGDRNPGANSLMLMVTVPAAKIFGP